MKDEIIIALASNPQNWRTKATPAPQRVISDEITSQPRLHVAKDSSRELLQSSEKTAVLVGPLLRHMQCLNMPMSKACNLNLVGNLSTRG